ncbi:anthranilate phosphoribosyltransferase [Dehalococcoidia bacterium]|nr:anthranilate phosphoribosyltransferase [Dehalococcoidia bacterium]
MIREAIDSLVQGKNLSEDEAAQAMNEMMDGKASPAQIAAFITALRIKGETVGEITGMARTMREKSLKVSTDGFLVDTCGTGGDGLGTFNVSTAAALVAAGAGIKVAKHGNRAASGACGSADVLETHGVKVDLSPEGVERCLEDVGIGFMFAPVFHPAMRHAALPRREIGIRTVFNILGPLTNPAGAHAQLLGVANKELGAKMAQALGNLGIHRAMVVHSEEGLDEISVASSTMVWELKKDKIETYILNPEDVGLTRSSLGSIQGGSIERNAELLGNVLRGDTGPEHDVVLMNAAAALLVGNHAKDLQEGVLLARHSITSGAAKKKLEELSRLSQQLK